jgi:prepilin-type N-terminal cleavage/methylation domain-containing protein
MPDVTRLRRQDGFTLVELLVVMMIGGIVLTGVASLMQVVMRQTSGIVGRTDASQRGRLVLDRMTRELRSQVCLDLGHPSARPALESAGVNSVTFFTDTSDGSLAPIRRTLAYDATNLQILETEYPPTTAAGFAPTAFSTTPRTKVLLKNVIAPATGLFSFKKYTGAGKYDTDTEDVGIPVAAADLAAIARITITMDVRPANARNNNVLTRLEDSVLVRNLSANYSPSNPDALRCE